MNYGIFFLALPGAGKTTFINKVSFDKSYKCISADILKENHPNYDPEKAYELHEWSVNAAEQEVYDCLQTGKDFVFDSGGINDSYSLRIMQAAKNAGYTIRLYYIDTPVIECIRRISERERKVPIEDVFNKYFKLKSCLEKQKKLCNQFYHIKYYTNKYLVFDMDGTLVEFEVHPLRHKLAPEGLKVNYIDNNMFEYAKPVLPMFDKLKLFQSEIIILSVSPNSETNKQKTAWLKKHLPNVKEENIYFIGNSENKVSTLVQIMNKRKISQQDLTYVDDVHPMLWEAANLGINAIHPSKFLTL